MLKIHCINIIIIKKLCYHLCHHDKMHIQLFSSIGSNGNQHIISTQCFYKYLHWCVVWNKHWKSMYDQKNSNLLSINNLYDSISKSYKTFDRILVQQTIKSHLKT